VTGSLRILTWFPLPSLMRLKNGTSYVQYGIILSL
jgi:hypothetical protein